MRIPKTASRSWRLSFALGIWVLGAGPVGAQKDAPRKSDKPLTFAVSTRQVQVSVVVHDKSGMPVTDLTAKDFQLSDQGAPQVIESFSLESSLPGAAAMASTNVEGLFHNQHPNQTFATVILLDRLNTAWADQAYAKNQIVKFLGQIQPDDRVGLYLLESSSVRVLHDFTTDVSSLLSALARHQAAPSSHVAGSEERAVETGDSEMDAFLAETTRLVNAQYLRNRAEITCEAMVGIANHLKGVRGRKNLIWVSSGFPLTFDDPVGRGSTPGLSTGTAAKEIERASRAMSEAGIAVYPVDARGLGGAFAVDPASIPSTLDSGRTMRGAFATLDTVMPAADTAMTIAENTGGRSFHNTNDIGGAIRRALNDARVTYLLGYSPSHNEWDGRFREIKVRVNRPGVEVRHRKGYIAAPLLDPDPKRARESLASTLASPLPSSALAVGVRLQPVAGSNGQEVNLAIRLDPRPLTLEPKGDQYLGAVSLLIAQSNSEGRFFKNYNQDIEMMLTAEMRDRLMTQGLSIDKKIRLREDLHRLHVVMGDRPSGVAGSVIIPAAQVRAAAR